MTYLCIAILILAAGLLSYFTSAWFGVKSSGIDKMPPHYAHLLQKLPEKESTEPITDYVFNEEEISIKR